MSNARNLANLLGTGTQITTADITDGAFQANKNLIINGAMQVWQRGTSFTGITGGQFNGPDRFMNILQTAGTWTVSQSTTAPDGFGKSLKWECTTADASLAAGDYFFAAQRMEGQNLQQLKKGTASAESVTLSFWVRSSKTGTYIAELEDKDNTRSISKSYTVSSVDTWEYKTLTFSGDTVGTLDDDNNRSMDVNFWLAASSTYTSGTLATSWDATTASNRAVGQVNLADTVGNYWQITGIQLEVGDTATPFEHRSYADELARCQRYYSELSWPSNHFIFDGETSTSVYYHYDRSLPVKMRATPSSSVKSGSVVTSNIGDGGVSQVSAVSDDLVLEQRRPSSTSRSYAYLGDLIMAYDAEL